VLPGKQERASSFRAQFEGIVVVKREEVVEGFQMRPKEAQGDGQALGEEQSGRERGPVRKYRRPAVFGQGDPGGQDHDRVERPGEIEGAGANGSSLGIEGGPADDGGQGGEQGIGWLGQIESRPQFHGCLPRRGQAHPRLDMNIGGRGHGVGSGEGFAGEPGRGLEDGEDPLAEPACPVDLADLIFDRGIGVECKDDGGVHICLLEARGWRTGIGRVIAFGLRTSYIKNRPPFLRWPACVSCSSDERFTFFHSQASTQAARNP
jgi:hypothetical protein